MKTSRHWAAILAGGDGVRLRSLTSSLAGDHRPKQYCRLLGSRTLLEETRHRVARVVAADQTVFVVTQHHARYYSEELVDVPSANIFEQPANRGTMAAVLFTLARLRAMGESGILGFFPSDHYYREPSVFCDAVSMAYWHAERRPDCVILLGTDATRAETDYGWIEPGPVLFGQQYSAGCHWPLRVVDRFIEKPSSSVAESLLSLGCLWNTMVVIGHVRALTSLLVRAVPETTDALATLTAAFSGRRGASDVRRIYQDLPHADLSGNVLASAPEHLLVMSVGNLGWTDLGRPERIVDVLAERDLVLENTPLAG
jgi:mannose-1-phosphate guanylyltransferase